MKKRCLTSLICLLAIISYTFPMLVQASDGTSYVYDGYAYDFWGLPKESPAAFMLADVITEETMDGIKLSSVDDVSTSEDGRIFVVDAIESRVNVFDSNLSLLISIKLIRDKENKIVIDENEQQIMLKEPEGVFVHEKEQELYIADTGAGRIVVLDLNDYSLKQIIGRPDNMTSSLQFKPSKIVVDFANRIYVIVQSSYEGIIEMTRDGSFSGFYGVNVPQISFMDYFWKSIASDKQKEQMAKTYAPAFNNIALDGEGFVMAVTYDTSADDKVFRFNSKGENVIREEFFSIVGDFWSVSSVQSSPYSEFVDLAVTNYGTYALLDRSRGHVFLYNFDGEMLNVFGSLGNIQGEFKEPVSIEWLGEDRLLIGDKTLKCVYVLEATEFGRAVLEGNKYYYFGKWDDALVAFENAIALNVNYEVAYSGIGKNYLMKDDYENAMYYFKLGNNRIFYSKAYKGYRNQQMEKYFGVIMGVILLLIGALIYTEIRFHKEGRKKG